MSDALIAPLAVAALVLGVAGLAKLRSPGAAARALVALGMPSSSGLVRVLAVGELVLGSWSIVQPMRGTSAALACAFGAFAVFALVLARHHASCGCFGDRDTPASRSQALLSAALALVAVACVLWPPHGLSWLLARQPAAAAELAVAIVVGVYATVLAYTRAQPAFGERAAVALGGLLDRRLSRRGVLARATLAGSAFAVAPLRYLIRPGSAWAVIGPGDCGGGLCTDGYTAFCCEIERGRNTCPANTYIAGWWKCTNYTNGGLCSQEGVRYYLDCNRIPGRVFPGGCQCAQGNCNNRRVDCNHFRYGQCNTQVQGTTEVVCRLIICQSPATVGEFNCNDTLMVDDNTCFHEAGCLKGLAHQLPGGGGA